MDRRHVKPAVPDSAVRYAQEPDINCYNDDELEEAADDGAGQARHGQGVRPPVPRVGLCSVPIPIIYLFPPPARGGQDGERS